MHSECLKLSQNNLLKVHLKENEDKLPNFSKYAIKRNAGEIALVNDDSRNFVSIYNGAGILIESIQAEVNIAELGWSHKEGLLEVIFIDGRFQVFSTNMRDYTEFYLLEDLKSTSEEFVLEAKFFKDEYIYVLTSENNFVILDLYDMSKFKYAKADCLEFNSPQNWCPLPDKSILFVVNSSLFKITAEDELIQKELGSGTICNLAVDSNSGELLVITSEYKLLIISSQSFEVILEIDVRSKVEVFSVDSINWYIDSKTRIVAISSSSLGKICLMDITDGSCLQLQFPKKFVLSNESDGLRILQNGQNWLILFMPQILYELTHKKSNISNYYELFITNQFDEINRLSNIDLAEIIEIGSKSILSLSYEKGLQENFINSIKFAVKSLEDKLGNNENSKHTFSYLTANFNRSLVECKVLSRLHSIGILISADELKNSITIEEILNRLSGLSLHGIALEIAILLDEDTSSTLMDWATKLIEISKENDNYLWEKISEKLFTWGKQQRSIGIDFVRLAEVCIKEKKLKLAQKFIKFEKDTKRKIELLVKLNNYREAVIESVQSGKSDQDFLAKNLTLTEFFHLSNISESVKKSLNSYCKDNNRVLLQILMYQDDNLAELISELINSSLQGDGLENLQKWFQLLRTQRIFEKRYNIELVGFSMSETFQKLKEISVKAVRDFSESIK